MIDKPFHILHLYLGKYHMLVDNTDQSIVFPVHYILHGHQCHHKYMLFLLSMCMSMGKYLLLYLKRSIYRDIHLQRMKIKSLD